MDLKVSLDAFEGTSQENLRASVVVIIRDILQREYLIVIISAPIRVLDAVGRTRCLKKVCSLLISSGSYYDLNQPYRALPDHLVFMLGTFHM